MADSPSSSAKEDNLTLQPQALINIAKDYHNKVCHDEKCIIYEKNVPKLNFNYGFILGSELTNLNIDFDKYFDTDYGYLTDCNFNRSITPILGAFLNMNMPTLNENLFFQYEIDVSQKSFNSIHTSYSTGFEQKYDVQLSCLSINNNIIVKYNMKLQRFTPFIQAGLFFNKNFYDYYTKIIRYDSKGEVMASKEDLENPFKNDFGLIIGVGYPFSIKRLNGNINLNYKNGYKAYFYTTTNIIQLNIAFNLHNNR